MFEKEAEEYLKKDGTKAEQRLDILNKISPLKITAKQLHFLLEVLKQIFQDGAEFGYNKALKDIMAKVKVYGLISSEACYSDVFDYENNRISEDELWNRFENNVQRELSMVITDMRIEEIE